jgi:hypothetical protein
MRALFIILVFVSCSFADVSQLYYNFRTAQDSESGVNVVEDYGHYKRHSGMTFEVEDTVTLDDGDSCQFAIKACGGDTVVHVIFDISTSAAASVGFYRDVPADSLDGSPDTLVAHNTNFNAAYQTNHALIQFGPMAVKNWGTFLFAEHFGTEGLPSGSGRVGGRARNEGEYILKPGSTYLIDIRSQADGNKANIGCHYYIVVE